MRFWLSIDLARRLAYDRKILGVIVLGFSQDLC